MPTSTTFFILFHLQDPTYIYPPLLFDSNIYMYTYKHENFFYLLYTSQEDSLKSSTFFFGFRTRISNSLTFQYFSFYPDPPSYTRGILMLSFDHKYYFFLLLTLLQKKKNYNRIIILMTYPST